MGSIKPFRDQSKSLWQALWLLTLAAILFSSVIYLGIINDISPKMLIRDPAAIVDAPFYLGFFSNLGVLFWAATVTVCFLTYSFLSRTEAESPIRPFLFCAGLLTLFLLFDDFFLLHEDVLPNYLGLNGNLFTLLVYGLSILSLLFFFRRLILSSDFLLLIAALGLLGLSMTLDNMTALFPKLNASGVYILEDLFKFLGIIAWFLYFSRLSVAVLVRQKKEAVSGNSQQGQFVNTK
jgi:hypothetical protein